MAGNGITRRWGWADANGKALASSVVGMIHCIRTFHHLTKVPLDTVVRMASLTPARIAGWDQYTGSIEPGKLADLVILDRDLNVQQVFVGGKSCFRAGNPYRKKHERYTCPKQWTYRDAGLDLDLYDQTIDAIGPLLRRTHTPRVLDGFGVCVALQPRL